jgi:hypothetical protein
VSLFDTVSQIGSAVGAIGGTGATYIWHRFEASIAAGKKALEVSKGAIEIANEATETAKKAVKRVSEAEQHLEAFVRAVRAELDALKSFPPVREVRESPIPGLHGAEELRREIGALREELRSEILRERGQRHAMQSELAQTAREQVKSWLEMTTSIAELKGAWEFLKEHILSRPKM